MLKFLLALLLAACAAPQQQRPDVAPAPVEMKASKAPPKVVKASSALKFYEPDADSPMLEVTEFRPAHVSAFLAKLKELDGKTPEIWVRLNTMGGSVFGGQDLIHGLEEAQSTIVCVVDWKAYSMGFYTLQSQGCDVRLMTQRASLMAHEPGTQSGGTAGNLRDDADLLDALNDGFIATASARMGISTEVLRAKTERRNWWLGYSEAEKWGAVDGWADPKKVPALTRYTVEEDLFDLLFGG
jgi:ATP-dependent protease ClpP protease subunit